VAELPAACAEYPCVMARQPDGALSLLAVTGLQAAANTQALAVQLSAKAFAMGEHSMTELIQNRRLAQESLRESQKLQLALAESWALMNLDLHRIWDFDE